MHPPKAYRYRVVDVFTEYPLEGNPLAVFPDARDLDASTMTGWSEYDQNEHSDSELKRLLRELRMTGCEVEWMPLDLGLSDSPTTLTEAVSSRFGKAHVLINNACGSDAAVPDGEYRFEVTNAEEKQSAGSGNDMIEVTL